MPDRSVNLPHPLLLLYSSSLRAKIGWDGRRGRRRVHNKCSLSAYPPTYLFARSSSGSVDLDHLWKEGRLSEGLLRSLARITLSSVDLAPRSPKLILLVSRSAYDWERLNFSTMEAKAFYRNRSKKA